MNAVVRWLVHWRFVILSGLIISALLVWLMKMVGFGPAVSSAQRLIETAQSSVLRSQGFQISGILRSGVDETVSTEVPGTVVRIAVRSGEFVHSGAIVAVLTNNQLVGAARDAADAVLSARAHVVGADEVAAAMPAQNRASVAQAQGEVVSAQSALVQAKQDLVSGVQSSLGPSVAGLTEQRVSSQFGVARAAADLAEAQRSYDDDVALFGQGGVSKDEMLQAKARLLQARLTDAQARAEQRLTAISVVRQRALLEDHVRLAQSALGQAEVALGAAVANAQVSKRSDVLVAMADLQHAEDDARVAQRQVDDLVVRAPHSGVVKSVSASASEPVRSLRIGDAVGAGQPVCVISGDEGALVAVGRGSRMALSRIGLGEAVSVVIDGPVPQTIDGRVVSRVFVPTNAVQGVLRVVPIGDVDSRNVGAFVRIVLPRILNSKK